MNTITIENLEALATELEANETDQRERLQRLIRSYARILATREPEHFARRATEHGDEAGHWDNSYPPKQEYRNRTGPRLLRILTRDTEDVATSSGFYHSWKRVTTHCGLYVRRDGMLFGGTETGTGHLGQFAAHPGDCNVECEIEWEPRDIDDVPTEELRQAEERLRELAFPMSQTAAS